MVFLAACEDREEAFLGVLLEPFPVSSFMISVTSFFVSRIP